MKSAKGLEASLIWVRNHHLVITMVVGCFALPDVDAQINYLTDNRSAAISGSAWVTSIPTTNASFSHSATPPSPFAAFAPVLSNTVTVTGYVPILGRTCTSFAQSTSQQSSHLTGTNMSVRVRVSGIGGCDFSGMGGGFGYGGSSTFAVSFNVTSPQVFFLSDNSDPAMPFQLYSVGGPFPRAASLSCSLSSQNHGTVTMQMFGGARLNGTLYPGDTYTLTIVAAQTGATDPFGMQDLAQDSFAFSVIPQPLVALIKAVKPSFSSLTVGTNYQLQVSSDLLTWTNQGPPFTATNATMVYPQYFDVVNWGALFFRLSVP